MKVGLGQFLTDPEIRVDMSELYRGDDIHLFEIGLNIFLRGLQQGLQEGLGLLLGSRA